jgi:hypothetical protein
MFNGGVAMLEGGKRGSRAESLNFGDLFYWART